MIVKEAFGVSSLRSLKSQWRTPTNFPDQTLIAMRAGRPKQNAGNTQTPSLYHRWPCCQSLSPVPFSKIAVLQWARMLRDEDREFTESTALKWGTRSRRRRWRRSPAVSTADLAPFADSLNRQGASRLRSSYEEAASETRKRNLLIIQRQGGKQKRHEKTRIACLLTGCCNGTHQRPTSLAATLPKTTLSLECSDRSGVSS